MKRTALFLALGLALMAGAAIADVTRTNGPFSSQPVIQGTVESVNDLQMMVRTDQGQEVTVRMDSRTLVPTDLATGMHMRADFRVLENGDYYAKRVIPLRSDADAQRDLAYAQTNGDENVAMVASDENESDSDGEVAENVIASDDADHTAVTTDATTSDASEDAAEAQAKAAHERAEDSAEKNGDDKTQSETDLPQTASPQPLIALLGLLSIAAAGTITIIRRRRHI